MATRNADDEPARSASPPCYAHEADPAYMGLSSGGSAQNHENILRWRKGERERLIGERLAIISDIRRAHGEKIATALEDIIGPAEGLTVSAYWPFRGEPDLRELMARIATRGGQCALPVVTARKQPLVFRAWTPGEPLEKGVWNIPVPATGEQVTPDVVISPVVGFDPSCYRLGYGGGFYDRTLAAMAARPRVIGVGYSIAALPTIYPQPHDIPMDMVITETGIVRPRTDTGGDTA